MPNNCILCGCQYFFEIPKFTDFKFVSSDCELTEFNSLIKICKRCGHIQKDVNEQWLKNVKKIYSEYSPYSLSEGREQLVFDGLGIPNHRSYYIFKQFLCDYILPDKGTILDVGCGNGELLSVFNSIYPEWDLSGFEIEKHQRKKIIDKKRGTRFFYGEIGNIKGEFDLITLFNVFEHISEPNILLSSLWHKLKNNGVLLVYVPNIRISLFDLLVFDHCSHFEQETMQFILRKNRFQAVFHDYHSYGRYLFAAAKKQDNQTESDCEIDVENNVELVKKHLNCLESMLEQVRSQDAKKGMGVFGTAIAGTWIAGMLKESVSFFVDEDVKKIKKTHLHKHIIHPKNVPEKSKVFLAFMSQEANVLKQRLEQEYKKIEFIAPSYK